MKDEVVMISKAIYEKMLQSYDDAMKELQQLKQQLEKIKNAPK